MAPSYSNLDLVVRVDKWPYFAKDPDAYKRHMEHYYYFLIAGFSNPFGYAHESFVDQMTWPEFWVLDREKRTLTLEHGTDFAMRTDLFRDTLEAAIESAKVVVLPKWTKEMVSLYSADGQHILDMDGIGLDAFGVVNFAVHMIGFVRADSTTKYWVPRRAKTKLSYLDMLDNTVGGSLAIGEKPIDCMVRECEEELCLDPSYTRSNLKACGTISYSMDQTDSGHVGCQHQVQYLYDLEFTQDIIPKIGVGEVGEVSLMTLDEVRAALAGGEFKLNCAMTWLAFLIRNGHITAENESDLVEICSRLHRFYQVTYIGSCKRLRILSLGSLGVFFKGNKVDDMECVRRVNYVLWVA